MSKHGWYILIGVAVAVFVPLFPSKTNPAAKTTLLGMISGQ